MEGNGRSRHDRNEPEVGMLVPEVGDGRTLLVHEMVLERPTVIHSQRRKWRVLEGAHPSRNLFGMIGWVYSSRR